MPNQNQVPHNHTPASAPGSHTHESGLALDINKTLNDIVTASAPSVKAPSLLSDTDETFVVSNSGGGTILTDTKGTGWSFSNAVKRSVNRWVKTKQSEIKEVVADKTIATEQIAAASTRAETVKKAAGNIAPGDGVQTLKKAPVVTERVVRTKPVSSIRVKPKNVPEEIGETKPRWKYIVESDESKPKVATKAPVASTNSPVPLLRDTPKPPLLLPPHKAPPVVVAREYRKPVTATTPAVTPKINTPVSKPATAAAPTPAPVPQPIAAPVPLPPKSELAPIAATEIEVARVPSAQAEGPTPEPTQEKQPSRPSGVPVPTLVLVIIFIAIIVVGNSVREWLDTPAEVPSTTAAVSSVGGEVTTIIASTPAGFASNIREASGTQSFTLSYGGEASVPATIFSSAFSGASRAEVGVYDGVPFLMIDFENRDTALGTMFELEGGLGSDLESLFALKQPYKFTDKILEAIDVRITTDILGSTMVYGVLTNGVIIITNTETALRELIAIFE